MKITRPRVMDFFVLGTGLFSFCASSRVSLAGAAPETSSTLAPARTAIAIHLLKYNSGKLLCARTALDTFIVANAGLRRQQRRGCPFLRFRALGPICRPETWLASKFWLSKTTRCKQNW